MIVMKKWKIDVESEIRRIRDVADPKSNEVTARWFLNGRYDGLPSEVRLKYGRKRFIEEVGRFLSRFDLAAPGAWVEESHGVVSVGMSLTYGAAVFVGEEYVFDVSRLPEPVKGP